MRIRIQLIWWAWRTRRRLARESNPWEQRGTDLLRRFDTGLRLSRPRTRRPLIREDEDR